MGLRRLVCLSHREEEHRRDYTLQPDGLRIAVHTHCCRLLLKRSRHCNSLRRQPAAPIYRWNLSRGCKFVFPVAPVTGGFIGRWRWALAVSQRRGNQKKMLHVPMHSIPP